MRNRAFSLMDAASRLLEQRNFPSKSVRMVVLTCHRGLSHVSSLLLKNKPAESFVFVPQGHRPPSLCTDVPCLLGMAESMVARE